MRHDQGNLHPHTTAGTRCSHETHAGGPLPSRHRRNPVLAETGDPRRFTTARAMIKHAGLVPREKLSGSFVGRTKLTRQGRPRLRLAVWRTVWAAQKANPVYAACHPDHPRTEHAHPDAGADGDRRGDPAAAARGHHHRPRLGSRHRRPRHPSPQTAADRSLTGFVAAVSKRTVGASPARH